MAIADLGILSQLLATLLSEVDASVGKVYFGQPVDAEIALPCVMWSGWELEDDAGLDRRKPGTSAGSPDEPDLRRVSVQLAVLVNHERIDTSTHALASATSRVLAAIENQRVEDANTTHALRTGRARVQTGPIDSDNPGLRQAVITFPAILERRTGSTLAVFG